MQVVVVLVGTLVMLAGTLCMTVPLIREKLFPASIAYRERDPAARETVVRAEGIVRRGTHMVFWPGFVAGLIAIRLADHATGTLAAVLIVAAGMTISVAWGMIAVRRWWRWAIRQGADLALVEQLASETKLVWPRHTWFGRRQRRTWMQLPTDVGDRQLKSE